MELKKRDFVRRLNNLETVKTDVRKIQNFLLQVMIDKFHLSLVSIHRVNSLR